MGTSLTALGARRVPCLLPSCFSLCGQPRPPPSHRGQTRGCLRFSPLDKPRALCPARPWPKATPPSGAPLSPRSAASDRRGRSVAAPQRLAGSGLGRDPGALAPGPMGCSAGDPRAAPGPAWSTVYPPWLRLPTPRAAWGPARHGGWGGDVTQAHVALDKRHGQPLAGAPTRRVSGALAVRGTDSRWWFRHVSRRHAAYASQASGTVLAQRRRLARGNQVSRAGDRGRRLTLHS